MNIFHKEGILSEDSMKWPASVRLDVKKLPLVTILVLIKESKKGFLLVSQARFCSSPESFHSPVIPLNLSRTEKPLKSAIYVLFGWSFNLHRSSQTWIPFHSWKEGNLSNSCALSITPSCWPLLWCELDGARIVGLLWCRTELCILRSLLRRQKSWYIFSENILKGFNLGIGNPFRCRCPSV